MNPKETGSKFFKHVKEIKDQAQKLSQGAVQTAGTVKDAVKAGVEVSKNVVDKTLKKETLSRGLDATAKGAKVVANTARLASKGVEVIAKTMDQASKKVGQLNEKLKK